MRNEAEAIRRMGRKPLNPIGKCFDSSAFQLLYGGDGNFPDTVMCHGIVMTNMPGEEGVPAGHAWLEATDDDGRRIALDTTWGNITKAEDYRRMLKVSYSVTYTKDEFIALVTKHGNKSGPFDPKIKAVTLP